MQPRIRILDFMLAIVLTLAFGSMAHAQSESTPQTTTEAPATTNEPTTEPTSVPTPASPAPDPNEETEAVDSELAPIDVQDTPPATPKPTLPSPGGSAPASPTMGEQSSELVEEESSSKGAYSRPLLFAPEDNGIEFTSPQIKWELTNGEKINLGGLVFSSSSIRLTVNQVNRDDIPRRYREGHDSAVVTNISFQWPSIMSRTGRLTVVSDAGKVLWSTNVDESARRRWLTGLKADEDNALKAHYKDSWGVLDIDPNTAFLANGTRFRFCLNRAVAKGERIRICSGLHSTFRVADKIEIRPVKSNATATVFVGKNSYGPRATVNFPPGRPIAVKVQFRDGSTVQFSSRPLQVKFLDIVFSSEGETLTLTGKGPKPLGKVTDLVVPPNHFWSATGIEKETIWQLSIPRDLPLLRVLGAWNVPFTYLIKYTALPKEEDRLYINTRTGSGTYVDNARIRVLSPKGSKVSSAERSVSPRNVENDKEYRWNFMAPESGKNNRARITVQGTGAESRNWVAHYQLYRGFPYEFSGRLTGIVAATLETVLIGEVAGSAWFERAFGSDSYYLSERRWGASARYFRAMQAFAFSGDAAALNQFSVLNTDLRYNLIPGIWNRDELFGLVTSMEMVDIGGMKANLVGAGAYWARTMPRVFDDLFNILPFFRYPKYVDVEFVLYPMSLSNDVEAGMSYNLNFHGKVFWTPRFYGEAGFGIKQFDYIQRSADSEVSISTAYGTIGLGLVF